MLLSDTFPFITLNVHHTSIHNYFLFNTKNMFNKNITKLYSVNL